MKPILEIQNISKQYKIQHEKHAYLTISDSIKNFFKRSNTTERFYALKNITLNIDAGESVGIIGRNGAGKSTLLKILSRITPPTKGKIISRGRIASLLEVGTGFHPELTGKENIYLNGSILGLKRFEINKNFDDIIEFSGVEKFLDTPLKHYSSGMQLRLAFAVAAHLNPEILIIDEVLAVGDLQFQKKCLDKMESVSKSGRTILFVSHNMHMISSLCHRAVLLENGQVVKDDSVENVINYFIEKDNIEKSEYYFDHLEENKALTAMVIRLTFEDIEGNSVKEVPLGSQWQIRIRWRVKNPIKHFIVAIGITTIMGVAVNNSWSLPFDVEPGVYEATFINKDILLSAGHYSLTIGLSSFERVIQMIPDAAVISISGHINKIEDKRIIRTAGSGIILNQMPLKIEKIET